MKINQESVAYNPITIVLENHNEAKAFFELIEKLDSFKNNDEVTFHHQDITAWQYELIRKLSNETQNKENAEEVVNRLRGQLQNCVNHLERARRNDRKRIYDDCIESANRALYETLTT